MGAEVICNVTFGAQRAEGRALLESSELIFRSTEFRLKIPFSDIKQLDVKGDALRVNFSGGTATFGIGSKASLWADKIRNPKTLLDKLGIRPEHRVWALQIRDKGFMADLKRRVPGVASRPIRDADVILFGAETAAQLARLAELRERIKRDGMIWAVTPKGKGGVKEADVMAAGKAAGLVDVKVAAFSATHTACRFVIPKALR